ncbi:MAG: cytochrome P450 [Sneathiella sp.]
MALEIPVNDTITLDALEREPYEIYKRLRRESPVVRLSAIGRVLFTKASDTHFIKTSPHLFGSHDTTTPMQRAFRGHTLMRKDGSEHRQERAAMAEAFSLDTITNEWVSVFTHIAHDYISRLPRGEIIDLRSLFAAPLAARCLARILGIDLASDDDLQRWASTLIEGAMNAAQMSEVFERCDQANDEMDACFDTMIAKHCKAPNSSALSDMATATNPLPVSQIRTNLRICIGGGLVETRDGLLTTLFGLLTRADQLEECLSGNLWEAACEEGLRWVAPIQTSPRLVLEETTIRGYRIPKGETVLAAQASANHDEDIWQKPEMFNLHRPLIRHQSFGDGAHNCLGQNVYRSLISQVVLPMLFDRFPKLALVNASAIEFQGFGFRGPASFPVSLN